MPENERAIDCFGIQKPTAQPLRMKLQADDGKAGVLDRFRNLVVGKQSDAKVTARSADSLMMCTVYHKAFSIEWGQKGISVDCHGMEFIFAVPGMCFCGRQMLYDTAAEVDIDDLHSFTDAEYRSAGLYKAFQQIVYSFLG